MMSCEKCQTVLLVTVLSEIRISKKSPLKLLSPSEYNPIYLCTSTLLFNFIRALEMIFRDSSKEWFNQSVLGIIIVLAYQENI